MQMWRCPHCATPQPEAARCWVCKRSSTTCSTCRHFRRAIASQLAYCGLDRRRTPISGEELRGCWTAAPVDAPVVERRDHAEVARTPVRRREFVPVGESPQVGEALSESAAAGAPAAGGGQLAEAPAAMDPARQAIWALRTTLWGDQDR
jgi:hypothetical protein